MGTDKAFIEIGGIPLWRRQLQMLRALSPHEIFIAGPSHTDWQETDCIIIPDAEPDSGPLAGIVAALQRCSAALLLVIAVDLPNINARYLRELLDLCADDHGVVPSHGEGSEPLAAVYPCRSLALAESCLAARDLSVQRFASRCVTEGFGVMKQITPDKRSLFANMNTPDDLVLAEAGCSHKGH